jgi:flagellar biosynthesis GTPase FlhF
VSSGPAAEKAPAETNEPGAQTGAKSDLSGIAVLTERLIGNRVEKDFAFAIAKQAAEYLSREPKLSAYEAFFSVISNHIAPAGNLFQKQERSTVLFLGTTGVGKTTSLVKIAADLSLNAKKKVGIINTDTYRIAAHEQLKIYSDILDIPVKAVYDGEMVVKAMQDLSDRDAILIDTPGKRPETRSTAPLWKPFSPMPNRISCFWRSAPRPLLKRAGKLSTVTASFGIIGC